VPASASPRRPLRTGASRLPVVDDELDANVVALEGHACRQPLGADRHVTAIVDAPAILLESGEPQGLVTVTGLLRLPVAGKPSWFTRDNDPARNQWFYWDLDAMTSAAKLDRVVPFYIEANASPNPGGSPEGGQTVTELPNNHLQYAITWYALAVALLAIYIRFARRRLAETRGE